MEMSTSADNGSPTQNPEQKESKRPSSEFIFTYKFSWKAI